MNDPGFERRGIFDQPAIENEPFGVLSADCEYPDAAGFAVNGGNRQAKDHFVLFDAAYMTPCRGVVLRDRHRKQIDVSSDYPQCAAAIIERVRPAAIKRQPREISFE